MDRRRRKPPTKCIAWSVSCLCLVLAWGSLGSTRAQAFSASLTGVAVDNSPSSVQDPAAGDVYAATDAGTIYVFDPTGALLTQFSLPAAGAITIDSSGTASSGNVYVADPEEGLVYEFEPTGSEYKLVHELSGLSDPVAIAVDAAGDIYVAQYGAGNVLEFEPSGEPANAGKPVVEGLDGPRGLAVDAQGRLFVAGATGTIELLPQIGGGFSTPRTIDPTPEASAVAVDSATGDIYVDSDPQGIQPAGGGVGSAVEELDAAGNSIGLPVGIGGESDAIAESEATKTVYATDWTGLEGSRLLSFGLLEVETGGAGCGPLEPASPDLCGRIGLNNGGKVHYSFEYGLTTGYGFESPAGESGAEVDIASNAPSVVVAGTLGGLSPNTVYHYRLEASSADIKLYGADETFKTPLPTPAVVNESSGEVTQRNAILLGAINSENGIAHYYFEYGRSAASEMRTPPREIAGGTKSSEVKPEDLSGLLPETRYYYRLVAEDATGVAEGEEKTFETLPAATSLEEMPHSLSQVQGTQTETNSRETTKVPVEKFQPKALSDAQKLARALAACRKQSRRKRVSCEKRARKQYGDGKRSKQSHRRDGQR
jgi:hypothetical protein